MRVLLLHNRYRAEAGEERAVADIAALLERRGDAVEVLQRSSAGVGRGRAARAMLAGGEDATAVGAAVRRLRADVVHAHNVHPLFGWRSLAAAREAGARTVLHLHNFRLFCAIGVAFRDGAPCHRCHGRNTSPGVRLRCRGSLAEAAVYGAGLSLQQPRLLEHADAAVVLSEGHGEALVTSGLPARDGWLWRLPNFVPSGGLAEVSAAARNPEHVLVAGRLVEEKGFDTAILAAREAGVRLVVAGEGPDLKRLTVLAGGDSEVRFAGWLDREALAAARGRAAAILVPSRCEEACPYAVLDAMAAGVPVLVSDLGGLPEMVARDAVLPAGDVGAWARAVRLVWDDAVERGRRGEEALALARERFGEDAYYERLMEIYGCVP